MKPVPETRLALYQEAHEEAQEAQRLSQRLRDHLARTIALLDNHLARTTTLLDLLKEEAETRTETRTLDAEAGSPRRPLASKVVGRVFWIARTRLRRLEPRDEILVIAHSEGRARAAFRAAARSAQDLDDAVACGAIRLTAGAPAEAEHNRRLELFKRLEHDLLVERVEDDTEVLGRFDAVTLDDGRAVSLAEVIEARARL